MDDPIEAIQKEEITISFNGEETEFLMYVIEYCASRGILDKKARIAVNVLNKFAPGIDEKVTKTLRARRNINLN